MKRYKVVGKFRFTGNIIEVGTIYKQDEQGDYYSFNIIAFGITINSYLPAAFVENNPKYFKEIKSESDNDKSDKIIELLKDIKNLINNQ